MLPGMEMIACPNLAVSPEVMQHIVQVESSANPYAIGVVGGQLERQPSNLGEALATVRMLNTKGYNYSLGLSQVNRANLGRYGLDTYEKAFDRCANLTAGAQILADCYKSAGHNWGKAFSCYYSGNFTTGFREGYVQKVFASINANANESTVQPQKAIALRSTSTLPAAVPGAITSQPPQKLQTQYVPGSAGYRVALRSLAIDKAASATVTAIAAALPSASRAITTLPADPVNATARSDGSERQILAQQPRGPSASGIAKDQRQAVSANSADSEASEVFVPQVRGPNDPIGAVAETRSPNPAGSRSSEMADAAATSRGQDDAAFVF